MTSAADRVPLVPDNSCDERQSSATVAVELVGHTYDIIVGCDLLGSIGDLARGLGCRRGLLVADATVASLYGACVRDSLAEAGIEAEVAEVPAGEGSKTLAHAEALWNECLAAGLDRGATLFALGGGVVGDLTGFVAGTFMRGVRFVQIPTTLLAQVDASVGGKTAIDLPRAKNAVGVFHQPALVVADVNTLQSLSARDYASGLAEIVKHAAIADAEMLGFLEAQRGAVLGRAASLLGPLVARNCQIKAEVVQADPTENGWRAVLNYGHTIGHALERAAGEWDLRHGEAVAYGMLAEAQMAVGLGIASAAWPDRLAAVLEGLGLTTGGLQVDAARARESLHHDKKLQSGRLRLPVVTEAGHVVLTEEVGLVALEEAMLALLERYSGPAGVGGL